MLNTASKIWTFFFCLTVIFVPIKMTQAAEFSRTQLVFGDVPFTITIDCKCSSDKAFNLIENGFRRVAEMNRIFSTYDAESEISRVNAASKNGGSMRVSRHFSRVLQAALDLWRETQGAFDPTFEMVRPDAAAIQLRGRRIFFTHADLRINPTGLVKGYTVDRVMEALKRNPRVEFALVAGSGDIAVYDRSGACHNVALKNPSRLRRNDLLHVTLCNQSVSTSGFYERGRHIVDTGGGGAEHLQVSVVADTTMISDGLDNAFMFMPLPQIGATLKKYPGTRVIVMEKNGRVR